MKEQIKLPKLGELWWTLHDRKRVSLALIIKSNSDCISEYRLWICSKHYGVLAPREMVGRKELFFPDVYRRYINEGEVEKAE